MERAVLLSDIEFLPEVHESDWERIEEDSSLVNVSKPLNENQQVVLEWWVKKLNEEGEDADPLGVICAMQSYGLREEKIYDAAVNLTPAQQYQVLAAFAEWAQEQEED
ncbi:hypothetical protein [Enterococcus malodoratus]|uniref:hypothetical protein n=1 Tax=Enterococcus malodoratus TaxID=71451 RepID=UPI0039B02EE3